MKGKAGEISAFEAKTRLSELLRETERGSAFLIRRRGKAVARLVPPSEAEQTTDPGRLVSRFREVRRRVHGPIKVRELIEEGRRF